MQVRLATLKDKKSWDNYVDNCPDAAPYCCFSWKEAVEQAYGHKSCYLLAEEDGVIKGILPLFDFRIPFCGSSFVSLPFCDVGDVFADNDDIKKALMAEAISLIKQSKGKELDVRSYQGDLFEADTDNLHVSVETKKVRMLLNLPGSSDELWSGFKSKLRSQVRKAEKNGLTFRWGGLEKIDDFYQVFSRNMHALGSPVHSKKWIEKILVNYGENARMGLVYKDDLPVGCGIILFTKNIVSIPWASTLREFNGLAPNMLIYWNLLKYATDNEKKVFDFGRSTLDEGTYLFKKQWGAEPRQLYWYRLGKSQTENETSSRISRKMLELIWQKLPLAMANFIGSRVRRYISL
ncbi:FemAB family XrtA/PEP-CTERM system-associated protein [Desulforhopalus sp. IMCC35007]|uniref:FemAB family XrtA/PEP-CTERM system-associated protein n=1 Tax=Desulforhopalus sp. IMCC35007 TaxID=2569543 RepID=UPI0010AE0EE9|nr:FemAB family XrtA/PEP-CTERM system-associated protein [Desulforhopalus sp. IMCC35007]TKB07428.1 FemAB family PEP-CTERM system-associated protein [Desulforhopalus sp. IMCC35007]